MKYLEHQEKISEQNAKRWEIGISQVKILKH